MLLPEISFIQGAIITLGFEPPSYELVGSDGALIRDTSEVVQHESLVV